MEVVTNEEAISNVAESVSNRYKVKMFQKLKETSGNVNKCLTMAMTIQAMYRTDLKTLIELFDFYKEMNQVDMASDLCQNDIFKNFNLQENDSFDDHLKIFAIQIIQNMSTKTNTKSELIQTTNFYLNLFLKFGLASQETLIKLILDKYRSNFGFLKLNETVSADKKVVQTSQPVDIPDFYMKLSTRLDILFIMKELLVVYPKLIADYGIFLIDGFLNMEKHIVANLVQSIANKDSTFIGIERRSLNLMRKLCVVDFIPDFVHLIEKLDNRHCYRWIEKSLEFFSKYTIHSIDVSYTQSMDDRVKQVKINYSTVKLLYVRFL